MFNKERLLCWLRINRFPFESFVRRAAASEYIIPYRKFFKSLNHQACIGARINFQCQNEDVSERSVSFPIKLNFLLYALHSCFLHSILLGDLEWLLAIVK